jgi:hypothetical protein
MYARTLWFVHGCPGTAGIPGSLCFRAENSEETAHSQATCEVAAHFYQQSPLGVQQPLVVVDNSEAKKGN